MGPHSPRCRRHTRSHGRLSLSGLEVLHGRRRGLNQATTSSGTGSSSIEKLVTQRQAEPQMQPGAGCSHYAPDDKRPRASKDIEVTPHRTGPTGQPSWPMFLTEGVRSSWPLIQRQPALRSSIDGYPRFLSADRRRHDGGSQRPPSIQSLQAPARSQS